MERSRQPGRGCGGGGISMPELKPCPACGSMSVQLMLSYSPWFTPASHVLCIDCQMQGPIACSQREEDAIDIQDLECLAEPTGFEITAIAAWNALPRALTWTHEPPKVAGWYWHHMPPAFGTVIEFFDPEISKAGCGEWAGPIAPPVEG